MRGEAPTTPFTEKVAVFLLGFAAFLPLYAPQSVLPKMAEAFSATAAEAGTVIGATTLAVALAAPIAGPLTDRFGRKRAMLAAITALGPLTLLMAFCHDLHQVLAARFLQGLVLPALLTGAVAYVGSRWSGAVGAATMGLFVGGSAMGGFGGRFIAGLFADYFGWQVGFVALACTSLLCAPLIHRWLPNDQPQTGIALEAHLKAAVAHWRNPRIRATALFGFTVLFAMTGTLSFLGFHLAEPPFSLTPSGIGLVSLVYPLGASIAPLNGRLIRRLPTRHAIFVALGICLTGQALLMAPDLMGITVGVCVFITGIFLCQSMALGYIGRTAQFSPGAAAGLYVCLFYLGGSVGAVLPGMVWHTYGWTGCVTLVSIMLLTGGILARTMQDTTKR